MTATTKRSLVPIMVLAIAGMALMAGCKGSGDPKEMGQEKPEVTRIRPYSWVPGTDESCAS